MENIKTLIKFDEMEIDKPIVIDVESRSRVKINGVSFTENLVSKVQFAKYQFDNRYALFVEIYSGHLELTDTIVKEDYIIEKNEMGGHLDYYIRKAESYDYN